MYARNYNKKYLVASVYGNIHIAPRRCASNVSMRCFLFVVVALFLAMVFTAHARFVTSPVDKFEKGIVLDREHNVYFAGGPEQILDMFNSISKYDKAGNLLWERYFQVGEASQGYCEAIAIDYNGNVYATGLIHFGEDKMSCVTIKYDTCGKVLWQAQYNVPPKYWIMPRAVAVDGFGNVYITSHYDVESLVNCLDSNDRIDFEICNPISDSLTIKYDPNGQQLWMHRYGWTDRLEYEPTSLRIDTTNNIYITGECRNNLVDTFLTMKCDENGRQLWLAHWPTDEKQTRGVNKPTALTVDADGCAYVLGYSGSSEDEYDNMITVKYSTNGSFRWEAHYRGAWKKLLFPVSIALGKDRSVYICGFEMPRTSRREQSTSGIMGSLRRHLFGTSEHKNLVFLIIKYDRNGKELWKAKYKDPLGRYSYPCHLFMGIDGGIVVVGTSDLVPIVITYDSNGTRKSVQEPKGLSELAKLLVELKVE